MMIQQVLTAQSKQFQWKDLSTSQRCSASSMRRSFVALRSWAGWVPAVTAILQAAARAIACAWPRSSGFSKFFSTCQLRDLNTMPDNMSERMPYKMPVYMFDRYLDRMPECMSGRMPEGIPDKVSVYVLA